LQTFEELELGEKILKSLKSMKFSKPTPVQKETIPLTLKGKDLIVKAATGSGKTGACAVPACQIVDTSCRLPQVLVIVPTRDLALQFATQAQEIGRDKGVSVFALYGGEGNEDIQEQKLSHGVQILIATPGRLIDFIYSRRVDLSMVKLFALDEADEMLSMGFLDDIDFIFQCLTNKPQLLLFSATFPPQIKKICLKFAPEAEEVSVVVEEDRSSAVKHLFYFSNPREKGKKLLELIKKYKAQQSIIFCKSRRTSEELCKELQKDLGKVDFLHAGLGQNIRNQVVNRFRQKKIQFLVATDVLSRGMDFSEVSHVFVFDLPKQPDLYVHRSGRTGRYDKQGVSISLVTNTDLLVLKRLEPILKENAEWCGKFPDKFNFVKKNKKVEIPVKKKDQENKPQKTIAKKKSSTSEGKQATDKKGPSTPKDRRPISERTLNILPPPPFKPIS
jgi:ATP-dependent RNA helicase DeaD